MNHFLITPAAILALALSVLACTLPPQEPPGRVETVVPRAAALEAYLDSVYSPSEPGAAVLVEQRGEVLLRDGYGMADLEVDVPMGPEHVFRIGSITKQFTAVAILMLSQEGKLALEDEIPAYLPDYPTRGHRITIEDLLRHTSGLRNYTSVPEYERMMRVDVPLDSLIARFRNLPVDFAPGSDWSYSNTGYVLLGKIIEAASGTEYDDFIRERIFEPAGMSDSYYGSARRIIPNRAEGYERGGQGWVNDEYLSMTLPHAAGALLSTVDDLARWYRALESGALVDPALLRRAHVSGVLADGRRMGYGYGWSVGQTFGHEAIEHGGGINGFSTYVLRVPDQDLFVAVLTNREDGEPSPGQVALRLAGIALGVPGEVETLALPPDALREYVGVYRVNEHERRQITLEDGRLYSQRTGGDKFEIVPVEGDVFLYPSSQTRAEFERDDAGRIVRMRMRPRSGLETIAPITDEVSLRPEAVDLPVATLERYTGEYRFSENEILAIVLVDGTLHARLTGQPEATLEPESETRFRVVEVPAWLEFERGDDGPADAVLVYLGPNPTRAPRIR